MSGTDVPHGPGADNSPVEAYLDSLLVALSGGDPRRVRHFLAETEAHLRDGVADAVAGGMSAADAEHLAVDRFGPAAGLARAERRWQATPVSVVVRQCVSSGLLLGGIGALAVGVSGLLAGVFQAVGGSRFVIDVAPGRTLSAADCARWLAGDPGAHSCRQAAIADWAFETIWMRVAAGLLGAAAIAAFILLRRRWSGAGRWSTLPPLVVDTVAVTLFGVSGIWLLGLGVDALAVASGHGAGQWLSAAPVALVAATLFGWRLVHDLRSDRGAARVVGVAG